MKLSYFSTHFPYRDPPDNAPFAIHYGGAENVAYNLALHMARRGHKVSVFTTSADSRDTTEVYDGLSLTVCRYGTNFRIEKGYFSLNLLRKPSPEGADIIHAHVSVPPGDLAALVCAAKTKTPLVVTYHGDGEGGGYGKLARRAAVALYNKFLLPRVLSEARVIICPSKYLTDESRFLARYLDKVVAIPNAVNLDDFNPVSSKEECRRTLGLPIHNKLVLFVGKLLQYKGPEVLIRAMAHIAQRVPDARLVLLGDGPMRGELERLVPSLGLDAHVKFAGFIGGDAKALYYKAADLLALPSTMGPESFGIVLLEASAAGLPLVVSDLSVFNAVVTDGHNGMVAKRGDDQSLASAIVRLLEDEELRDRMGQNAIETAKQFSWDKVAEEYQRLYEGVLSGNKVQPI